MKFVVNSPSVPGNAVIVTLAQSSDDRYASFHQVMLSQVWYTFLSNHKIWLHSQDVSAHFLYWLLLQLQDSTVVTYAHV
jgi:hypothetical protein